MYCGDAKVKHQTVGGLILYPIDSTLMREEMPPDTSTLTIKVFTTHPNVLNGF
jgi:hypothetical protein